MGAGVSEAVHQLLGARSSVGSKGPGEVAKVMEVEIFDANLGAGLGPGVLEDVRGERAAFLAGEDVALGGGLSEHLELMAQILDDHCRNGDDPLPGIGLGWTDEMTAMAVELALLDHAQLSGFEVDVATTEPEQLALAKPDEGGDQHQTTEPGVDRLGKGIRP